MNALLRLAVLCAASLLSGCTTYLVLQRIKEPPDLAMLDVAGVTRPRIEKELGEPVRQHHNVSTYRYFIPDKRHSPWALPVAAIFDVYTVGTSAPQAHRILKSGRRETNVAYAPSGRLLEYWHKPSERAAVADFREWLDSGAADEKLDRLMASAYSGYAPAQFALALRYQYPASGAVADTLSAYKWARLAAFGGHAPAHQAVDALRTSLSAEQVTIAEQSIRAWPDDAAR